VRFRENAHFRVFLSVLKKCDFWGVFGDFRELTKKSVCSKGCFFGFFGFFREKKLKKAQSLAF